MSPTAAELVHAEDCPGPAVVERESAHRRLICCRACGAMLSLPRVSRWSE